MKKISILVLVYTIVLGTMTMLNSCDSDKLESGYAVTVTDDGNGEASVSVGGKATAKAKEGAIVTLTATPSGDYRFKQWTVVSGDIILADATANPATFTMPAGNIVIKVEFTPGPAVQSDYYGTWKYSSGNSSNDNGWGQVTLSEDELVFIASSGGYVLDNITWTAVTNTHGSHTADYPTGYRITGTLTAKSVYSPRKADGSGETASVGDITVDWVYIHTGKGSLMGGSWSTVAHEAVGDSLIKQP